MQTTNRPRAALIAVLGVIVTAVAFASPASAYGPAAAKTTVSTQSPTAGVGFQLCGSGFKPGETVTSVLNPGGVTLGSDTANASGAFCMTVVLGASITGANTIGSTGQTSGEVSRVSIMVGGATTGTTKTTSSGGGTLANTGGMVIGISALGGLFVVGGATMLLAGRRRKVVA